jgi:serine/threonine protein kinase
VQDSNLASLRSREAAAKMPGDAATIEESVFSPKDLVARYRIFADTSCFFEPDAYLALVTRLLPALRAAGKSLLISSRTIAFLQAEAESKSPTQTEKERAVAWEIIRQLRAHNVLVDAADPHPISGDPYDTRALFTELFVTFQGKFDLCLITARADLAQTVVINGASPAFRRTKSVMAIYSKDGEFRDWRGKMSCYDDVPSPSHLPSGIEATIATSFKIFADTSALMLADRNTAEPKGAIFFVRLLERLRVANNPLILAQRVMDELRKHEVSNDLVRARSAQAAIQVVEQYASCDLLRQGQDPHEIEGYGDSFADPILLKSAVRFQSQFDLCFITQDEALAKVLLQNFTTSSKNRYWVTFISDRSSELVHWQHKLSSNQRKSKMRTDDPQAATTQSTNLQKTRDSEDSANRTHAGNARVRPFHPKSEARHFDATLLPLHREPSAGDSLIGSRIGKIPLVQELASGGEGKVYLTDRADLVAKIYHRDQLSKGRYEKLKLMCSRDIGVANVCWPIELLSTEQGEFVGFTMNKAAGKPLRTSVFFQPALKRLFPTWKREHLIELALSVLKTIQRLHALNIFIGDINPLNILVQDERSIFIVDTDSFQIEDFPCPVGTETFTPPNLQNKNFGAFLRTNEDELFAVATILFMILFPGKAPYSSQGAGEAAENILNMKFAYGVEREGQAPAGPWQFIWSHLSRDLKKDFTAVFSRGERVSCEDWIKHLKWYLTDTRAGNRSNEIFPTTPWQRIEETVSARCDLCPPEQAHQITRQLAEKLLSEGRSFRCKFCATAKKFDRLENTREVECCSKTSPTCEMKATASLQFLEQLQAEGKRFWCRSCREYQRILRQSRSQHHSFSPNTRHYSSRNRTLAPVFVNNRHRSKFCFVATAAYRSEFHPDVVWLRAFRDRVLMKTIFGSNFVEFYYRNGLFVASIVARSQWLQSTVKLILIILVRCLKMAFSDVSHCLKEDPNEE